MPMVQDAYRFLFPILGVAVLLAFLGQSALALLCLLLGAFVCYFFRNPRRLIPQGAHLVVSPADGKVVGIHPVHDEEGIREGWRVSIFLNIFDVHVNRSPIEGSLESLEYRRGKFKAAFHDAASRVNEQNVIGIHGPLGRIVVRQVAGWIARRVVCWRQPGSILQRGELIGLIRFGSRVDVLLPSDYGILVSVGQRVKGGSSVLGEKE